jgi:hypothetical protein
MILQNAEGIKQIYFSNLKWSKTMILEELQTLQMRYHDFYPIVTLEATEALRVAYQIIDCFKRINVSGFKS